MRHGILGLGHVQLHRSVRCETGLLGEHGASCVEHEIPSPEKAGEFSLSSCSGTGIPLSVSLLDHC